MWTRLHNEELHAFLLLTEYCGNQIKQNAMGETCRTSAGEKENELW